MKYDVIIVGGGPAGLFAAYHLKEYSKLKVLLIEKGKNPLERKCPNHNLQKCIQCDPCNILSGIGGAGLYSDGKLNFIPRLGKTDLTQFMSMDSAQELIDETEQIFTKFKMDGPVFPTNMNEAKQIRKEAKRFGIDLLLIKQKHLGSDNLPRYIADMAKYIKSKGLEIKTKENVVDIIEKNGHIKGVITDKGKYNAASVILAPGRIGANWMSSIAQKYKINLSQRGIEVGIRVESTMISWKICVTLFMTLLFLYRHPPMMIRPEHSAPTRVGLSPLKITRILSV